MVEAAHVPWQPLGAILVDKGLLTDDELERALIQQARTGRRLGETLVELGYVSRTALTRALAAQYGLEVATERGFGTGLRAELERRHDPELEWDVGPPQDGAAAPADLAVVDASEPDDSAYAVPELAHLEDQWALLAAANQRLAEAEQELTSLRGAERRRRAQVVRLLERLRSRNERSRESRPAATPPAAPTAHLVLVRLAGRYELVERDGAPPEPGESLELGELGEGAWLVDRIGRSPLPNDPRPCAFVEHEHPAGEPCLDPAYR